MDLANVYRIFHRTSTQYTFFLAAHGAFSQIDHILEHKASISKYKKIEIIPCILSDHNALKLEVDNKNNSKKTCKQLDTDKHGALCVAQCVINETKEEIKRFLEINENENMT
jgi:DNA integrity scanning protein DisA with diadenylate cyclase activity